MTPIDNPTSNMTDSHIRPKRQRTDPHGIFCNTKCLELEGIIKVLRGYEDYDGGINCSICGKLYRSKVCFTKHLWEHSVYWDLFDGERNQDRVLSIQAALILYSGNHGYAECGDNGLSFLLVTAPHSEKKRSEGGSEEEDQNEAVVEKKRTPRRSPTKRRSTLETSSSPEKKTRSLSVSEASSSDTEVAKC